MNNGIAIALSAAFIQAISHTVLKKSYQDQPPSVAYLIDALFGMLIWIPFTLFLGVDLTSLIQVLPYALLSAVLAEAYVFYILSKGTLSLTNTVFYTYPMFTIIISRFVNHESLTPSQLGAVLIILIGILIMSFPKKIKRDELKHIFTLLWPLSAAFTVGISDSMSKNIITQTSPETFLFCLALAQLPIATIYYVIETKSSPHKLVFLKQLKYPLIASFLMVTSMIFFWYAFAFLPASIASPLTGTAPLLVLVLARIWLKEKISPKDTLAALITIAGIIWLNLVVG